MILRAQIFILGAPGAVCGFDQAVTQPRTPFACSPGAALTRRFVVPGAHTRPRRQMPGTGKAAHIAAGFRPTYLCRAPIHARNRVEQRYLLLKRAQSLLDLLAEPFDSFFQVIDLSQMLGNQETLVRFKPTAKRLHQLLALPFKSALCQISKL